MSPTRIIVAVVGKLFAAIGVGFWIAPETTAAFFQLEAIGVPGLVTLRADLGGLFVGLAVLCLAGALHKSRSFLYAAALVLSAIVFGRLIGIVAGGDRGTQLASLVVEIGVIAALVACARALSRAEAGTAKAGRPMVKKTAIAAGALTAVAVVTGLTLLDPRVELWIFERGALQMTGTDNGRLLTDDAMRVSICGSSAPLPSPSRGKACAAVYAGGKIYIVDVGPESVENMVAAGIPLGEIGGVLLTHFHSDHIGDLGELNLQSWVNGRRAPMRVYGGPGIDRVVNGFNEAYRLDQGYRTAHHTARLLPAETWPMEAHPVELDGPATHDMDRSATVLEQGALKITAIEVNHEPIRPAYAYRFDYKGRSVVVSGDLKYHPPLAKAARGADVLVIESISRPMTKALQDGATAWEKDRQAAIMHDVQDYHIDPAEAADLANQAGVKLLAFYHLLPAPDNFLARRLFQNAVRKARVGDWTMAEDNSLYTLPIGSDEVRIGKVRR
jgi:ribonuclease Z